MTTTWDVYPKMAKADMDKYLESAFAVNDCGEQHARENSKALGLGKPRSCHVAELGVRVSM